MVRKPATRDVLNTLHRMRQGLRASVRNKGVAWEAMLAVLVARLCVRFCLKQIAPWAFTKRDPAATPADARVERRIAGRIEAAARRLPGESKCLPQAIAAKWMLARRGVASTVHLGFGFRQGGEPHAHAWLEAGNGVIVGDEQRLTVTHLPR